MKKRGVASIEREMWKGSDEGVDGTGCFFFLNLKKVKDICRRKK